MNAMPPGISKRNVLKSAAVGTLYPIGIASGRDGDSDPNIGVKRHPPDIGVINNSSYELEIHVLIRSKTSSLKLYENSWKLKGRNQQDLKNVESVYFRGDIDTKGKPPETAPWDFEVEGSLPSGETGSTDIFVNSGGLPPGQLITVSATEPNTIEVTRSI